MSITSSPPLSSTVFSPFCAWLFFLCLLSYPPVQWPLQPHFISTVSRSVLAWVMNLTMHHDGQRQNGESVEINLAIFKKKNCHIYTRPYSSMEYEYVSIQFPSEVFSNVRHVSLFDERPFEHSFSLRLSQSFPSLRTLSVINEAAQLEKHNPQQCGAKECAPVIRYPFLRKLHFVGVHDYYVEQFIFATKTFFSAGMLVRIAPDQLKRVTLDFMRDETRINCSKVQSFSL